MAVEFVDPQEELSQGDLIGSAPSVYVRSLAFMVQVDKNRYMLRPKAPEGLDVSKEHQTNVREGGLEDPLGNAMGARRFGLVLSHDCEIDKSATSDKGSVLLAQVRPLERVHEEDQPAIREYREKRAFYLPGGDYLADENYVDFRVITTIRRSTLDDLDRLGSMNEDGRLLLRAHLFRFFTRRTLPADWLTWPEETE